MTALFTGPDRRAQDRRILPAADALGAHMQRKAAEERAALAEQQRDALIEAMREAHDMSLDEEQFAARQHLLNAIAKATGSAS